MITELTRDTLTVRRRRLHISGAPNTRKTTALLTLPKPLFILSSPGEKGYGSIPLGDPAIASRIWESAGEKSAEVVKQVEAYALEIIGQKHGPVTSLAFDGFHKFVEYIADDITGGAWFAGDEFKPQLYAAVYRRATRFLDRLSQSAIPVFAITTWADNKQDKPGREQGGATHIMPDLPGKYSKEIMGEFDLTVHQTLRRDPKGVLQACWQTRTDGEVWGCGLKGPARVVTQIPTFIPADYAYLDTLWTTLEKETSA